MLDPLTAVSLASCVVQFTDFGIKLVAGSIELYSSANGVSVERAHLEQNIIHIRKLADKIILLSENEDVDVFYWRSRVDLGYLAKSSKHLADDLLSVLEDLKVKKPAGPGRKWESFQKAVAALTLHNKRKVAALEKALRSVQANMFNEIQIMMR